MGAAAPIGPVNVEIARRTLRGGFLAGFALGCGAVSIDVTYALLSSLSLGRLMNRAAIRWPVTVGGIGLLLYLAFLCFRGAGRDLRTDPLTAAAVPVRSHRAGYLTGLLMTLLNPMTLAFWFLVVPGMAGSIPKEAGNSLPMICIGVFIGTLGWVIGFAGLLGWLGRWGRGSWLAIADAIGGLVLFGFAAAQIWRALRPVL